MIINIRPIIESIHSSGLSVDVCVHAQVIVETLNKRLWSEADINDLGDVLFQDPRIQSFDCMWWLPPMERIIEKALDWLVAQGHVVSVHRPGVGVFYKLPR
jgi:hypothetical protein